MIDPSDVVESQVHIDLHSTVHPETSSDEVDGSDRRMMTDLLQKYGTSCYLSLIGFTENGVERFLGAES